MWSWDTEGRGWGGVELKHFEIHTLAGKGCTWEEMCSRTAEGGKHFNIQSMFRRRMYASVGGRQPSNLRLKDIYSIEPCSCSCSGGGGDESL